MKYKHVFSKQNKALLAELVRTDFKLRYQGSVLGYAWSLLRPLLMFVILYIVFVKFIGAGADIPHFPAYLLVGIVVWNFFHEMTTQSLGSVVGRSDLIRKIRIPRWIIVLSSSISALINLGLNFLVVMVFVLANHVQLGSSVLWVPLLLLEVYVLALGVSLFMSAAFVKFRDVSYIWEVIMQAGFYITPILYSFSMIQNDLARKLIFMNPMAQAIQDVRYTLITNKSVTIRSVFDGGWYSLIPLAMVTLVLVGGFLYFRHESKYFAENV